MTVSPSAGSSDPGTTPELLRVCKVVSGATCRLDVIGELDVAGVETFGAALMAVPDELTLTIDLSKVDFIDSSGVGALITARNRRDSTLVSPSKAVRRTFELANVEHLLEGS